MLTVSSFRSLRAPPLKFFKQLGVLPFRNLSPLVEIVQQHKTYLAYGIDRKSFSPSAHGMDQRRFIGSTGIPLMSQIQAGDHFDSTNTATSSTSDDDDSMFRDSNEIANEIAAVDKYQAAVFRTANSEFNKLGLFQEIGHALNSQDIKEPTPVQRAVIPRLLGGESLVMAASTGSGKTLAYILPIIQMLQAQEQAGYRRQEQRPRCVVLVPTRELARQVLQTIKSISHFSKVSSAAVLGGEKYALQKKSLSRLVDIVVASPGRLLQHKIQGNVYMSHVSHVIIDEIDTMLMQGFGSDVRAILRTVLSRQRSSPVEISDTSNNEPVQIVMATATLTSAVKRLLNDAEGGFNIEYADPNMLTPRKSRPEDTRVKLGIVEVDGVHRSLPNVNHVMEEVTGGADKIELLKSVIAQHKKHDYKTLIFCNTVASCKAVLLALSNDVRLEETAAAAQSTLFTSYHGDLLSTEREANLAGFRNGSHQYMVCTDIAARGLDIPETGHIILFDFPLNPVDYLHRAGRCGRAGRKGLVTSLVAKRDVVLANAIKASILKGLPIDALSSDKRDYLPTGRLAKVVRVSGSAKGTGSTAAAGRQSARSDRSGGPKSRSKFASRSSGPRSASSSSSSSRSSSFSSSRSAGRGMGRGGGSSASSSNRGRR